MKEILENILHTDKLWAVSRAGYMLSIISQLEDDTITQSNATDWMYDVIRHINEEADDEEIKNQIVSIAKQIGQIVD